MVVERGIGTPVFQLDYLLLKTATEAAYSVEFVPVQQEDQLVSYETTLVGVDCRSGYPLCSLSTADRSRLSSR